MYTVYKLTKRTILIKERIVVHVLDSEWGLTLARNSQMDAWNEMVGGRVGLESSLMLHGATMNCIVPIFAGAEVY